MSTLGPVVEKGRLDLEFKGVLRIELGKWREIGRAKLPV